MVGSGAKQQMDPRIAFSLFHTIPEIIYDNDQQKVAWLNTIDAYSKAKDMKDAIDLLTYLMKR